MAKRNSDPPSGADKAKVRVFFAEVEGNNESVQDALKTMLAAMNRPSQPVRVISEQRVNGKAALLASQAEVEDVEETADEIEEAEVSEEEEVAPPTARKPRGTRKLVDRNAGLSLVANLDFMPDGQQTLKQFLEEKKPKTDMETTLAMVFYMQHVMALSKIGPAHVVTAYKEAQIKVPVDVRQTIRNAKYKKMWLNFDELEDVKTTTQGENLVQHNMGKSE
jgi:hypothetical protein